MTFFISYLNRQKHFNKKDISVYYLSCFNVDEMDECEETRSIPKDIDINRQKREVFFALFMASFGGLAVDEAILIK